MKKSTFILLLFVLLASSMLKSQPANVPSLVDFFRTDVVAYKPNFLGPLGNVGALVVPASGFNYVVFHYSANHELEIKQNTDLSGKTVVIPKAGDGDEYYGYRTLIMKQSLEDGEIVWHQKLVGVEMRFVSQTVSGKLRLLGRIGGVLKSNEIWLGDQVVAYAEKQRFMSALLDPETGTWSNIQFIADAMIETQFLDNKGNHYIAGRCKSAPVKVNNTPITTEGAAAQENLFIAKFSPANELLWAKKSEWKTEKRCDLYNLQFTVDNNDNVYIAGGLGHKDAHIAIDGVEVKNDTIMNADDFSYTDIFLYKINPQGTIVYSKTYLQRGNEMPLYLKPLKNGDLYLCGKYKNQMIIGGEHFPICDGDDFYQVNGFIGKVNGATGELTFGVPIPVVGTINGFTTDEDENIYFVAGFTRPTIRYKNKPYYNRSIGKSVRNLLIGKVAPDGNDVWTNVLGAKSEFGTYIQHEELFVTHVVKDKLLISRKEMEFGTNRNLEWGADKDAAVATNTNNIVVDALSGQLTCEMFSLRTAPCQVMSYDSSKKLYNAYQLSNYGIVMWGLKESTCSTNCPLSVRVVQDGDVSDLTVELYKEWDLLYGNRPRYELHASQKTVDGVVVLDNVADGRYLLKVIGGSKDMDTYYPDKLLYEETQTVYLPTSNGENEFTIQLRSFPPPLPADAHGVVSGTLTIKDESWQQATARYVYALPAIDTYTIYLKNSNMQDIIAVTQNNAEGKYQFTNVPAGTYSVIIERLNHKKVNTHTVTLNANDTRVEGVDYEVYWDAVVGKVVSSIKRVENQNLFAIFPNPAKNYIHIQRKDSQISEWWSVELCTMDGRIMKQRVVSGSELAQGLRFPLINCPRGVYLLKLNGRKDAIRKKLVIE